MACVNLLVYTEGLEGWQSLAWCGRKQGSLACSCLSFKCECAQLYVTYFRSLCFSRLVNIYMCVCVCVFMAVIVSQITDSTSKVTGLRRIG